MATLVGTRMVTNLSSRRDPSVSEQAYNRSGPSLLYILMGHRRHPNDYNQNGGSGDHESDQIMDRREAEIAINRIVRSRRGQ